MEENNALWHFVTIINENQDITLLQIWEPLPMEKYIAFLSQFQNYFTHELLLVKLWNCRKVWKMHVPKSSLLNRYHSPNYFYGYVNKS